MEIVLKSNKYRSKLVKFRESNVPICWYGTLDTTKINHLDIDFDEFHIDIDCNTEIGCTGPQFLSAVENSKTEAAKRSTTIVLNELMNAFAKNMMGSYSDEALNRKAKEGQAICDCNTNPDVTPFGPRGPIDLKVDYSPVKQYTAASGMTAIEVCEADVRIPSPFGNGANLGMPEAIITTVKVMFYWFLASIFYKIVREIYDRNHGDILAQRAVYAEKKKFAKVSE